MAKRQSESLGPESMKAATGRVNEEWRDLLEAAGAKHWNHTQIAKWVVDEHGIDGWWAQAITVDFEQERKGRLPGQKADGTFSTAKTKTIAGERLAALDAVVEHVRAVHGPEGGKNFAASMPNVRWKLADGSKLLVSAGKPNASGTPITITHDRLPEHAALEPARVALTTLLDTAAAATT